MEFKVCRVWRLEVTNVSRIVASGAQSVVFYEVWRLWEPHILREL